MMFIIHLEATMMSKVVVIVERSMFILFGIFVIQIVRKPRTGTVKNANDHPYSVYHNNGTEINP